MATGQGQKIASMFASIGADVSELQKGMAEVKSSLAKGEKGFDSFSLSSVMNIAKVTAAIYTLKKGFDFAQQGAMLSRLETAGDQLAASYGQNMDDIVAALDKAAHGTIANTDLILSANRAMMLGVSTDAEQLANLLEVAALRGRAMGLSTTQAFNDIVTGVGRMSPLILDNLGIVVDLEARTREWAEAHGVAAEKVDATTKREILLNGVLKEGNRQLELAGGLLDDTATAYETLGKEGTDALHRLMIEGGRAFEAPVKDLGIALKVMNDFNDLLDQARERLEKAGFAFAFYGDGMVTYSRKGQSALADVTMTVADLVREQQALNATGLDTVAMLAGMSSHGITAAASLKLLGDAGKEAGAGFDGATADVSAFWAQFQPDVLSDLLGNIEALDFAAAGGQIIAELKAGVDVALANDAITQEQATAYYHELVIGALQVEVAMGNLTYEEAAEKLKTAFNTPIQQGIQLLKTFELTAMQLASKNFKFWLDVDAPAWFIQLMTSGGVNLPTDPYGGLVPVTPAGATPKPKPKKEGAAGGATLDDPSKMFEVGENGREGIVWDRKTRKWKVVPNTQWMRMRTEGATGMAGGGSLVGTDVREWTGGGGRRGPTDQGTVSIPMMGGTRPKRGGGGGQQQSSGQAASVAAQAAQAAAVGVGASLSEQNNQSTQQAIQAFTQANTQASNELLFEVRRVTEAIKKLPLKISAEIAHEVAYRLG